MKFLELNKKRHATKQFTDKPVDPKDVRTAIEIATLAPSAHNSQPWKFVVVREKNAELAKLAYGSNFEQVSSAPVTIALFTDTDLAKRARKIADLVHCNDVIIIDKNRYVKNKSKVMNIIGDPKDKNIIIIDDMIDTAGTICHAAAALKEKGANHVSVMATHPVFSGNAYENLNKEDIDKIIITNTLTIKPELTKVDFIDISEILAENIYQIFSQK